jgi:hypothetical protein
MDFHGGCQSDCEENGHAEVSKPAGGIGRSSVAERQLLRQLVVELLKQLVSAATLLHAAGLYRAARVHPKLVVVV